MEWLRWHIEQHKGLILGLVLLAALLVAIVLLPAPQLNTNAGFGPDWECTAQGQGGPTCIKKIKP
jgi:hypothetical protein